MQDNSRKQGRNIEEQEKAKEIELYSQDRKVRNKDIFAKNHENLRSSFTIE